VRPLRGIAGRLFLSYLAVVGVGLLVAAVAIGGLLFSYVNDQTRLRLVELATPFQAAIQAGVRDGKQPREIVDGLVEQANAADARLLILGPNGGNALTGRRVLIDTQGSLVNTRFPAPEQGNIGAFTQGSVAWIFIQQPLQRAAVGAGGVGTIVVARPRAVYGDTFRALLPPLVVAGLAAAGFALIVAGVLAGTITRPLRDLAAKTRAFAAGDHDARVPPAGPSEVRELGGAFNDMADEIQRARGSEQAFLADISHELRTPLTSIQGFSQAIVEGEASGDGVTRAAGIIHRESRRLGRMVEGLLQVAKLEAGASEIARDAIDPAALLHAAVGALEMQAHESGVRLEVEAPHLPAIVGDADRLSQLFINVLDNAVKHAPRDTVVVVSAARTGGEIVVRVRDAGPGLPGADPDRLFERFYRSDTARPRDGAGLGLAIASAIAQAHGGRIEARNADTGGAEFVIHLPLP
jgi:signal transduction histidine kinase